MNGDQVRFARSRYFDGIALIILSGLFFDFEISAQKIGQRCHSEIPLKGYDFIARSDAALKGLGIVRHGQDLDMPAHFGEEHAVRQIESCGLKLRFVGSGVNNGGSHVGSAIKGLAKKVRLGPNFRVRLACRAFGAIGSILA